MTDFVGTPSESERLKHESILYKMLAKAVSTNIRVALPGIVQTFDSAKQTVTVNLVIRDKIKSGMPAMPGYNPATGDIQIPTLLDVPVVFPRAGGLCLTFPVSQGDECLVIFGDMCINSWWQNGGVQNQETMRRHDLSDGFAILGPWSQPRTIPSFSPVAAQLRTDTGNTILGVSNNHIQMTTENLEIDGITTTPHVGTFSPTVSLPVMVNGVQYYLGLSTTP